MGEQRKVTIELSEDMAEAMERAVARGEYASLDEAIEQAVAEYEASRWEARAGKDRVRAMIQAGIDSGPSGPMREACEELISELEALARAKGE
jgi:antitoxin ParD1/3/4